MIALRWKSASTPEPSGPCTVFAARLPLRVHRTLPGALRHAARLHRHLPATPGLVGHTLAVDIASATLWTVSAWDDRTALAQFERSAPHRAAKNDLRGRLTASTFVVWACPVRDLPIRWSEIRGRIGSAADTGS